MENSYGNLKSFSYVVSKTIGTPKNYVFASWEEAFDAIIDYYKNKRFVLAIDEYPYIVRQDNSFSSVLQEFIDRAHDNVFLLISGSDVSFLHNEILSHKSPLYKRKTFAMELKKLSLSEAMLFLKNVKSKEEKIKYLTLYSTYPYYLSSIDSKKSFYENIKDTLFNQYGTFFNIPDNVLSNATKVQDIYNSILNSITHRHRSIKDISLDIHEEHTKVSKYIKTLVESEILEKKGNFYGNNEKSLLCNI